MSPISPATVHLVLAHISPLDTPLPPHLVSKPLLQRHHFLGLTPDNVTEYLAWPSSEQSHVVELLQSQLAPSHEDHLPVHYTADTENLTAHVRITPDLRLLFLWDNQNGWQYHNLATMPFPSNSYTTFSDAFAAYAPDDFLPEQGHPVPVITENDEDSYWDSYGPGDDDSDHPSISRPSQDPTTNSEDAYWAQYSSVHGSGDSTLPSPRPMNKKLGPDMDTTDAEPDRIIVPSDDFQIHHTDLYNPLEPPAPESLARRLEALKTETGRTSPSLFDDSPTSDSNTASPHMAEVIPASEVSSSSCTSSPYQQHSDGFIVVDSVTANIVEDVSQSVLQANIKSLYQLWRLGRQQASVEQDKELFLSTVTQALEQL